MPDITMCTNYKCPLRWDCARSASAGVEPSERQSYSFFRFRYVDDDTLTAVCEWEVPLDPDRSDDT